MIGTIFLPAAAALAGMAMAELAGAAAAPAPVAASHTDAGRPDARAAYGTGPVVSVRRDASAVFLADGERGVGEYPTGADEIIPLTGAHLPGQVYLKRFRHADGAEELRVYFSIHDINAHQNDRIDFYFDRRNDGVLASSDDVALRITRASCAHPCQAQRAVRGGDDLFNFANSVPVTLTNAQVRAENTTQLEFPGQTVWTGEFVLHPADLGWGYFPASVGVMVLAQSGNPNEIAPGSPNTPRGRFPAAGNETAPGAWGNLHLRYPIDFALSLDYSGSMLALDGMTQNRWNRAKRAADLFAATLGLFRNDAFQDRVFLSQYSWPCGNQNEAANTTGAVQGVVAGISAQVIPPPPGPNTLTGGNIVPPASNNCTPVLRGVRFALANQLGFPAGQDDKRDRVVVLLSDGFHNIPTTDIPFIPATAFTDAEKAFADVVTVALGPDGSAGTLLLSQIASEFGGFSTTTRYNQTTSFSELLTAYLDVLQDPLTINVVGDAIPASLGGSYDPGAPDRVVFIGVWNDPAQASELTVHRNGAVPSGTITKVSSTQVGYAAVAVDGPAAGGTWSFASAAMGIMPNERYVLVNLRVLARYPVAQRNYTTGEPILLRVALTDRGVPLLGAEAAVEVARPGEALGNYLSTVQEDCSLRQPALPRIDAPRGRLGVAGQVALATTPGVAGQLPGDPPPGRYALAAAHFARCGKEALERDSLPGLQLFDDGTHGDEVAGDGVYSRLFTDTQLEGSYNFRITARGTTTDAIPYSRTRRFSQFVQVKPDAASTTSTTQAGGVVNGLATTYFIFLPRDRFGGFLGPGFADHFRLSVIRGTAAGPVQDAGNGYYVQAVQHPAGTQPVVSVEMPTTGFATTFGAPAPAPGTEIEIFGSFTQLDAALAVDAELGVGLRLASPLAGALRFELEGGTTLPELTGDSIRFAQLFAGLRLDLASVGPLVPSVSAGGGVVHFQNGANETAAAGHAGGALTFYPSSRFGLRASGRVLYLADVRGAGGTTTGSQFTLGLVFRP